MDTHDIVLTALPFTSKKWTPATPYNRHPLQSQLFVIFHCTGLVTGTRGSSHNEQLLLTVTTIDKLHCNTL